MPSASQRHSAGRTRSTSRPWPPGWQSLANGGALHFGGGKVHQTVIEMERGFLFVTAAGEGSCLAVLAAPEADVGLLAYEMALIVKRLGRHTAVSSRPAAGAGEAM